MTRLASFTRRIRSGYLLSFVLLLVSYFLIFYVQQRLVREAGWVVHSYAIINHAESLKAELTDAETGARGYVITLDARFLRPYNSATQKVPELFKELRKLILDNPGQQKRLDTLEMLIQRRMDSMSSGLARFRASGFRFTGEVASRREVALQTMDSTRLYVARIKTAEEDLLEQRKIRLSSLFEGARMIAVISLLIVFAGLLFSLIIFNYENKAREKADKRADKYRVDLESNKSELKEKDMELKELREMEKFTATGRIARTIAHEVRNPLTNILLATEQLKELENKNEESPILLDLINRNAARINQLVSDLLNATRFTQLDFKTVELNKLVDETLEMAKDRIELKGVTVEKNYDTDPCSVAVDREKMKVALLNIIVNAIEAMEEDKGILAVKTSQQGNKCLVEIRDNGKGMDEEMLQKLFEPYFTGKIKGNGLGLTNTQNIILNHRGNISVYSKPGKGATFLVTLSKASGSVAQP